MHISESKNFFNMKSSTYYGHSKTKILADFPICTGVPLSKSVGKSSKSTKREVFLKEVFNKFEDIGK